ncbi:MAG TPA: hypothetical protein VFZ32_01585 [Micromonosporaceae bacterium]
MAESRASNQGRTLAVRPAVGYYQRHRDRYEVELVYARRAVPCRAG